MAQAPARHLTTALGDSRRWRNVARRPGDIIISTASRGDGALLQSLVVELLSLNSDVPVLPGASPWVDDRDRPIDEVVALLDGQQHRRVLLTTSPGDCLPFDARCSYLAVISDGPRSFSSWTGHRAAAVDVPTEDVKTLFDEWLASCPPPDHLAGWWSLRHEPNLLFVHATDLASDGAAQIARIATFLDLAVADEAWFPQLERDGSVSGTFADAGHAERYDDVVAEHLSGDAASWFAQGTRQLGTEPSQIGTPPRPVQTAMAHPLKRLGRRQLGAMAEISERRIDDARERGLFDDLPGHGKPIADIDQQRRAGWWAERFVRTERSKVKAMQLEDEIRNAKPALWRLATEGEVRHQVGALNRQIAEYNRVTTVAPVAPLDMNETVATWARLREQQR